MILAGGLLFWLLLALPADIESGRLKNRDVFARPTQESNLVTNKQVSQFCSLMSWMKPHQHKKCLVYPFVMPNIQRGVGMALKECENHFKYQKWNCSGLNTALVFQGQGILQTQTRESAYVYALTSAGASYQITKGCTLGNWDHCGCDTRIRGRVQKKGESSWEWGGCSENVGHGDDLARRFMDPDPPRKDVEYLITKHNNEAGRRALKDSMVRSCKCRGVSGSCADQVCWRTMPNFSIVAELLRKKFDRAARVKMNSNKTKLLRTTRGRRGKKRKRRSRRPSPTDLVFTVNSPDFCQPNTALRILGTQGRLCNKTSIQSDGCSSMCCGRGHDTMERSSRVKCNCEFIWCCKVQCDWCTKNWSEHRCR